MKEGGEEEDSFSYKKGGVNEKNKSYGATKG